MITIYLTNSEYNAVIDTVLEEKQILPKKVTGVKSLTEYMAGEGGRLPHVTNLIIDLRAFESNSDEEILSAIHAMRQMYSFRIIIIAMGYEENSLLLSRFVDLGIYNIAIGNDQNELPENVRPCFSPEGKQYMDCSCFKLHVTGNEKSAVNSQTVSEGKASNRTIVKEKPVLLKPYITMGLCGIDNHIGTTHHALAMTKHISKSGLKSCYVEANNHNKIEEIKDYISNVKVIDNMLSLDHLRIFPNANDYMSILKQDFNVYVFDYGTVTQTLTKDFLTMDMRIVISGGKPWELTNYFNFFANMNGVKGLYNILLNA